MNRLCQRGNAIVEFALVLPVFIIFTFGIVDVGRYAYYSIIVANAARAGGAYAAQNVETANDSAGIEAAAKADAGSASSLITVSTPAYHCQDDSLAAISCSNNPAYIYVAVTVSGTFNPLLSYPKVPGKITISDTANMRVTCTIGPLC